MEKKENLYAQFDARVVQELEQRNEFDLCDAGCLVGIGEVIGGGLLAFFGAGPGAVAGGAIIIEGGNDIVASC